MCDTDKRRIADLEEVLAVLNAELAVAQADNQQLIIQRDATRRYLGVAIAVDEDASGDTGPVEILRLEVNRILREIGADRKIQCIKELRSSDKAHDAWGELGNGYNGSRLLGLKESKDIIDAAGGVNPRLYLGVKGFVEL